MEAGIVPCGFTIVYLLRNMHRKSEEVTETATRALVMAAGVAVVGAMSPLLAWSFVVPPLVIFVFFLLYQKTRNGH
jgi:hypothetical protein